MHLYNSRDDINGYSGTPQHDEIMNSLSATINRWERDGENWNLVQDASVIERYGFAIEDFPNAPVPDKPHFVPGYVSPEEQAAEARNQRDALLRATDWMLLSDSPHDTPEMRAYRQALRDVPQQEGFPDDIVWPEKP